MILVDTSAWVEFDRATGSPTDQRVTSLIERGGGDLAVTEPVLMEVLARVRSEQERRTTHQLLRSFRWLPTDPVADYEGAAALYRRCRERGVTPRGLLDCLVATVAMRTGASVLAVDGDFDRMATVVPLRLDID